MTAEIFRHKFACRIDFAANLDLKYDIIEEFIERQVYRLPDESLEHIDGDQGL